MAGRLGRYVDQQVSKVENLEMGFSKVDLLISKVENLEMGWRWWWWHLTVVFF